VGGRTLTVDLKISQNENETDRFDLGGQWVTGYNIFIFSQKRFFALSTNLVHKKISQHYSMNYN
jgi:hypothetical protein